MAEAVTTEPSVVLVSYGLWEQRLGLRDDIVGQPLVLDGIQHTIVGVMPREFRFPSAETRAWIAWQAPPVDNPGGTKTGTIMRAIGRLKPGVTTAQAAAEGTARAIAAPDAGPVAMALFGAREPIQITVTDAMEAAAADVRPGDCDPADRIGACCSQPRLPTWPTCSWRGPRRGIAS